MEIKLENSNGLALWVGRDDIVQVPMDPDERAQCRKALLDALDLLDQTIVKWSTFSTADVKDQFLKQNQPRLSDCLAVYGSAPPSRRQVGNLGPQLRLVSADLPLKDY